EHPDSAGDGDRAGARLGDRVRHRHGVRLRLARDGQARDRFHLPAGPGGGRGLPAGGGVHVYHDQPGGGPAVFRARSAGQDIGGQMIEETPWRRFFNEFISHRLAMAGLALLLIVIAIALFAPWISPQNPYDLAKLDLMDARMEPGGKYLLGTDGQGRDMLSAIFYGLRVSLTVGVASGLIALTVGGLLGVLAAYAGG